ncbi:MAG TPA: PepSY domain-containing protein [Stellaceae bacterium]|nr:PepSY domain-containing protein [Stellaceae bacterium]
MRRIAIFPIALIATALSGAPIAYAVSSGSAETPNTPALSTSKTASPSSSAAENPTAKPKTLEKKAVHFVAFSDHVSKADIAAFANCKIALDRAISTAESDLKGKAVEAVFKATPDQPHYVVWVMREGRVYASWIDGRTGRMTWHGSGIALARLYPGERAEFLSTARARSSLRDAVAYAHEDTGNKPIAATFERIDGAEGYYVAVVSGGKSELIGISPNNLPTLASK